MKFKDMTSNNMIPSFSDAKNTKTKPSKLRFFSRERFSKNSIQKESKKNKKRKSKTFDDSTGDSKQIHKRAHEQKKSYISPVYQHTMTVSAGDGNYLFDDKGVKYLDFTSGIAVNAFGHNKSFLLSAIQKQTKQIIHASNIFATPSQLKLCKALIKIAKQSFPKADYASVFLANSGTEANEGALKFAKRASREIFKDPAKTEIIAFKNGFHGRSSGALSLTSQKKYREPFEPLLPGVKFVSYNSIPELKNSVNDKTMAIIFEMVQGEGGLEMMTESFAKTLQDLANTHNVLIIVDEIQTGLYRTGSFFASMNYPIMPDLITLSKALGGGLPLGAVITSRRIHEHLMVGDHGSTTGGNPVACAAALAVISQLNAPITQIQRTMSRNALNYQIKRTVAKYPDITALGKGHLRGLALPPNLLASDVIESAQKKNLLLLRTGDNSIRIAPSLICSPQDIRMGMKILQNIFRAHYKAN